MNNITEIVKAITDIQKTQKLILSKLEGQESGWFAASKCKRAFGKSFQCIKLWKEKHPDLFTEKVIKYSGGTVVLHMERLREVAEEVGRRGVKRGRPLKKLKIQS